MAKWYNKFFSWLKKTFPDIDLPKQATSWLNSITQGGATQRDKDLADISLENQQTLNEEEFERKQKWFEMYEAPAARARQYEEAGLNKMLLAGGGASVSATGGIGSAGSAGASASGSGTLSDVLGPLMQLGMYKLQKRDIESQILKRQTETDAQRFENKWNERLKNIQVREAELRMNKLGTEIDLNVQNLEKLAADTDFARIYASYAPALFQMQIHQGYATAEMNTEQAKLSKAYASLTEEQKREIESKINLNSAEASQIRENIKLIQEQVRLVAEQKNLTHEQIEETKEKVKNLAEDTRLLAKKVDVSDLDIAWYAANHTEVVDYDKTAVPGQPIVTFKDNSGVYTSAGRGDTRFRRPYQPGGANKKK